MPSLAPSWKSRPLLPSKPCRTTSALIGKSYIAAGQAGMALHTMAILQAYQADVLKEMDEGTGLTPEAVKELRRATDLALRATKQTAHAVGRPMAGSVAAERHLWLNLTEISEKEEVFLLDAPISQSGLFGEAVSSVVEKFRSAKTQSTALKQFMPWRTRDHSTPSSSLSREQSSREQSQRSLLAEVAPRLRTLPQLRFGELVVDPSPASAHADGLTWSGPIDLPLRPIRVVPDLWVGTRRAVSPLRGEVRPQKRFCPLQTCSPHTKLSQPPLEAWRAERVHPHLFSVWQLGDALSFPRYSPSFRRQRAACVGTQSVLPCSVRTPCWPPVSPALHTPSTRTRTPRALLRGGGCRCSRFGPATHFSLGKIPPSLDGVQLTVVNSASKASVLQL